MAKTVYVLNGPNMNLLGTRQPEIYGRATIKDVEKLCREAGKRHGFAIEFHCSNHEGALVDLIQQAGAKKAAGIIINGAGFTTTSVAIHDAIKAVSLPVIEVHVTNIFAREVLAPRFGDRAGRQSDHGRLRHPGLCARDRGAGWHDRQEIEALRAGASSTWQKSPRNSPRSTEN